MSDTENPEPAELRIREEPANLEVGRRQGRWGPFSGRQLMVMFCALMAAIVLLPGTVYAVDAFSNVAIQDPVTGVKAKVSTGRSLQVGDASGPLTVDGTVKGVPLPPTTVWSTDLYVPPNGSNPSLSVVTGPSLAGIELTSLAISGEGGHPVSGVMQLTLFWRNEPSSATSCADASDGSNYDISIKDGSAFSVSFPTPLQLHPPAGQKICLMTRAFGTGGYGLRVNASGYYG
jgi:hypothetical protein